MKSPMPHLTDTAPPRRRRETPGEHGNGEGRRNAEAVEEDMVEGEAAHHGKDLMGGCRGLGFERALCGGEGG